MDVKLNSDACGCQVKHDDRLTKTLSTVQGATGFWTISCLWGVVCCLPHTLGVGIRSGPMGLASWAGVFLFSMGFGIESLADLQKWQFKQDSNNRGKFCDTGLWGVCQHPNYFGNLLLWSGIVVLNSPALRRRRHWLGLALLSPVGLACLFYAQASGQMMDTVKLANAKYGHDARYQEYVNTVPLIVPYKWASLVSARCE